MSILSFVPSIFFSLFLVSSFSKITRLLTWVFLLHYLRDTFSDPFPDIPQVEFWCKATSTWAPFFIVYGRHPLLYYANDKFQFQFCYWPIAAMWYNVILAELQQYSAQKFLPGCQQHGLYLELHAQCWIAKRLKCKTHPTQFLTKFFILNRFGWVQASKSFQQKSPSTQLCKYYNFAWPYGKFFISCPTTQEFWLYVGECSWIKEKFGLIVRTG